MSLATTNDFIHYAAGNTGMIDGVLTETWHKYMFDVICFPREFRTLERVFVRDGLKVDSDINYYEKRLVAREEFSDFENDSDFDRHEGEVFKTIYSRASSGPLSTLVPHRWLVSMTVKGGIFHGQRQLKGDVDSSAGRFAVFQLRNECLRGDELKKDQGLSAIVSNVHKFLDERGAEFPGKPASEAQMLSEHAFAVKKESPSQESSYPPPVHFSPPAGDPLQPIYSNIRDLQTLSLKMTNQQPSYYVHVTVSRLIRGQSQYIYISQANGMINCKGIEVEIEDLQGETIPITVAGDDLLRFLSLKPKMLVPDRWQFIAGLERDIKSTLRQMVFKDKKYSMLIKKTGLAINCNGNGICLPVWRWMYADE
ncbi:hypothetical protein FOA43_001558 [Brettanomyces nanus]|uniref:Uncharacterized protein n=1 Tax=Eeniella nana TaxID=13502 RepID=A0A875RZZ3_EENNA|nr:uncharacterized protein FOA43_001558 [Brettanomyces nanus]QPG74233.1 hypothetical protein FOA43_001558 [Brettanomyces nanus]